MPSLTSHDRSASSPYAYLLHEPDASAADEYGRFPLLLFLHGAGERGDDVERVKIHGPISEFEQGRSLPFFCVAPLCPADQVWQSDSLSALLDTLEETHLIDFDRIYISGLSMGGYGTWALAAYQPQRFAAIAPICGGGNPVTATMIAHLPTWVVHGDRDEAIPISQSQLMVDRMLTAGASNLRFDVIEGGGHNVWTDLYASDEFYDWLLAQKRK